MQRLPALPVSRSPKGMGQRAEARQQLPNVSRVLLGLLTPPQLPFARMTSMVRCNREVRLEDLALLKDVHALLHLQPKA
jgi:hypothetical protein